MTFGDCSIVGPDFVTSFIKCVFKFTDTGSGSIAGWLILFGGLFAMVGIGKVAYGFERAFAAASFVGVIASMIMVKLDFVSSKAIYICIALFIVSLILMKTNSEPQ